MSSTDIPLATEFPPPPARVFCVGIGGIGVSGLAQLLVTQGYSVAGSDRGIDDSSKAHLYEKLKRQGIRLYPQDGSGITSDLEWLCASTAVEDTIPDIKAAKEKNIPIKTRPQLLSEIFNAYKYGIAVGGTSGKNHHHRHDRLYFG